MDIFGPLPLSPKGNKYILLITDLFSNYPEGVSIPDKSAETVADVLITKFICRFGVPQLWLSDNGGEFSNHVKDLLSRSLAIKQVFTSSYHPRSNGQCERINSSLKSFLAKYSYANQSHWENALPYFLMAFRSIPNSRTGFSPHFLISGQEMRLPIDVILSPNSTYYGDNYIEIFLRDLHNAFVTVRQNSQDTREKVREKYNSRVKQRIFQIGDLVYFYKDSAPDNFSIKLGNKWKPFFRIIEKIGPASYKIVSDYTGQIIKTHEDKLIHAELVSWDEVLILPRPILCRQEKSNPPSRIMPNRQAKLSPIRE